MLWLGERTRRPDGGHATFFALGCLADGELLQGRLLSLHWRGSGAPTQVETLQTSCPYELPEPADVYAALCARYGLDAWPDQDRTSPQARPADPNILQFRRKQA